MTTPTPVESNIELVRTALDSINRGDMAGLAATVTADFQRHDLARAFVFDNSGADPLTSFITMVRAAMPDFYMDIVDIFATEDRAAARIRLTGTHLGDFMGTAPSGRRIEISGVSLYSFRDGRICENNQLLDMAGLLRELTGSGSAVAVG